MAFLELPQQKNITKLAVQLCIPQPAGFLREPGKERWELTSLYASKKIEIKSFCNDLNMIQEVPPHRKSFDYALLAGASIHRIRARISYLIKLWNQGIRFEKLIFLVGQRPVSTQLETYKEFINKDNGHLSFKENWQLKKEPHTETEIAIMVMEQSILPSEWEGIPIEFIDTPMQKMENGLRRPSRQDTIFAWLATTPLPGTVLSISNQPFVGYDDAVLRRFVPPGFTIEAVGDEARKNIEPEVLLDTIARWLYNAQYLKLTQLNMVDM